MNSSRIKNIKARQILDSRGNPTIEAEVETGFGVFNCSVPSGASTGKYEAVELRDKGKRYSGKGVLKAVENVNKIIAPRIKGEDSTCQKKIDEMMIGLDGTEKKSRLGANAICAVSLAVCRAGAGVKKSEVFKHVRDIFNNEYIKLDPGYNLPAPSFNIINGGLHAGNSLDFQEFMINPRGKSFSEEIRMAVEIYHRLKDILRRKYGKLSTNLGDEGGFAPPLIIPEQAIALILAAAESLNYREKVKIFIDVAASQFFSKGKYKIRNNVFTREGLIRYYKKLVSKYPIVGLEDPFAEDDWDGFKELMQEIGNEVLIIGDDLLVTNPGRIEEAEKKGAVNSMILKINQIGTVSEALAAAKMAKDFNWKIMVSHRSGETTDDFIADFAVGIGADFIKTGAPARGERVAKYNRLLRIEEAIKTK